MGFLHQLRVRRNALAITAQTVRAVWPDAGPVEWFRLLWRAGNRAQLFLIRVPQSAEPGVLRFRQQQLNYVSGRVQGLAAAGVYPVERYTGDGEYSGEPMLLATLTRRKPGRMKTV